ncbi:MAG: sensor histidine kinase [Candidatus Fimenecus sp.]
MKNSIKSSFILKLISVLLLGVTLTAFVFLTLCMGFGVFSGVFKNADNCEIAKKSIIEEHLNSVLWQINYNMYDTSSYPDVSGNVMYEVADGSGKVLYSDLKDTPVQLEKTESFSEEYSLNYVMRNGLIYNKELFDEESRIIIEEYLKELESEKYYKTEGEATETTVQYDVENVTNPSAETEKDADKIKLRTDYTITVKLTENLSEKDSFYLLSKAVNFVSENKAGFAVTMAVSAVLSLGLFIFLMCASGHKSGVEGIHISRWDKFPIDIILVLAGTAVIGMVSGSVWLLDETLYDAYQNVSFYGDFYALAQTCIVLCFLAVYCSAVLLTVVSMTSAVRLKTKTFIKSSLAFKTINLTFKFIKKICKLISKFFKGLPLVWKTVAAVTALFFMEMLMATDCFAVIVLLNLLLAALAVLISILLKKIQIGTKNVADGNIYGKIDTSHMFGDIKSHAENINRINDGIAAAVQEQMKSERFKTELITNVSHDIKTPLTSIINYVDLLEKEDIENHNAKEYIEVISRQSARLKKLIVDLIEASKASTGNISVEFSEFEIGILLSQAMGEYNERFNNADLELVLNKSEEPITVVADSRLMWRVFDNVLNNISKYAQPHTRVYIDAVKKGKTAEILFKNVSKEQLNISGDELMERFVRGDSSRNTEGSGLGLSIAKSLAELQNGSFEIDIDGDLFKVRLTLPLAYEKK